MKKFFSKAVAIAIAGNMFFSSASVAAAVYTPRDAAKDFQKTLELIEREYLYTDSVNYQDLVDAALKAAFDQLDPYSMYLTQKDVEMLENYTSNHRSGMGIVVQVNDDNTIQVLKVYEQSPAEKAGIRVGDVLLRANGEPLTGKTAIELGEHLSGDSGTNLVLEISRDGAPIEITVIRGDYFLPSVEREPISTLIAGADDAKVAYVAIDKFDVNTKGIIGDTEKEFKAIYDQLVEEGVTSLILDLRGNGGGDVQPTVEIAKLLTKAGTMFTIVNNKDVALTYENAKDTPFKIAVLVNDSTASAAEMLSSAIKESGSGIIVGSLTYGKGVGQSVQDAPDGRGVIRITFSEVITRNGNRLNGVGVSPDIYVETPSLLDCEILIDQASTEEEIVTLRKLLTYLGYTVNTQSTEFTDEVANALKQFQKDEGIDQNGICTPELQYLLNVKAAGKYLEKDIALQKAYDALIKE